MNTFGELWGKLRASKEYREGLVASQLKRGIPFQIRQLIKDSGLSQEQLADRAGISQGVVSRAANPNYGNLTLNTLIRMAAGFDVAFMGKFVPFSELGRWFVDLSEDAVHVETFEQEDRKFFQHDHSAANGHDRQMGGFYGRRTSRRLRRRVTAKPHKEGLKPFRPSPDTAARKPPQSEGVHIGSSRATLKMVVGSWSAQFDSPLGGV